MNYSPRALLHLLFNGSKAIDVVETAHSMGLLEALEKGPVTLGALSERFGAVPGRLYKFLDCLESLGLVDRVQDSDVLAEARYTAAPGLAEAAEAVVGPKSLERNRDTYAWRTLRGKLPQVLRGEHGMSREHFDWPPKNEAQIESFEKSMAAGLAPIVEVFATHQARLWRGGPARLLDVGGGDGTLAAALLAMAPSLRVDVYNLPAVEPLVSRTRDTRKLNGKLGFVGGDFLTEPLPRGYDALSFVRVLHDWPAETARLLMTKAHDALPSGGRILICEEFRTPERLAGQFFWTYFLMGVDSCVSRLREADFYLRALAELGFEKAQVLPGPFELIVATKN